MNRDNIEHEKARIKYEDASDSQREQIRALTSKGLTLAKAVKQVLK